MLSYFPVIIILYLTYDFFSGHPKCCYGEGFPRRHAPDKNYESATNEFTLSWKKRGTDLALSVPETEFNKRDTYLEPEAIYDEPPPYPGEEQTEKGIVGKPDGSLTKPIKSEPENHYEIPIHHNRHSKQWPYYYELDPEAEDTPQETEPYYRKIEKKHNRNDNDSETKGSS